MEQEQNYKITSVRIEASTWQRIKNQDNSIRQLIIKGLNAQEGDNQLRARIDDIEAKLRAMEFSLRYAYKGAQDFYNQRDGNIEKTEKKER